MSERKDRITRGLREIGACYAGSAEKFDGGYHIHPDASYPHQDNIEVFASLSELEGYITACKQALGASDLADAMDIMDAFYASLS